MADEKNAEGEIRIPAGASAKIIEQKRMRTERYRRIYSNNFYVEFSGWDMSIVFGEIVEGNVIEELAHITMSHAHGKAVAAILANNIKNFEKQFGEIKIPIITDEEEKN